MSKLDQATKETGRAWTARKTCRAYLFTVLHVRPSPTIDPLPSHLQISRVQYQSSAKCLPCRASVIEGADSDSQWRLIRATQRVQCI
jgi:hypothetical protein